MRIRRSLLALIASLVSASSIAALDWGGSLGNQSSNQAPTQEDMATLWIGQEFSTALALKVQGSYAYMNENPHFYDIDEVSARGTLPFSGGTAGALSYALGRIQVADGTELVYSGTIDGASLSFSRAAFSVSAWGGYTGLLFGGTTPVYMSAADRTLAVIGSDDLGGKRIVEALGVTFPELFLRQDLRLEALAEQDHNDGLASAGDTVQSSVAVPIDSQFYTLRLSGPLVFPLYWNGFFTLETGNTLTDMADTYADANQLAYMGGLDLQLYLEKLLGSRLELSWLYTSGDGNDIDFAASSGGGNWSLFLPVTNTYLGEVYQISPGNVWRILLSYSLKPLSGSFADTLQLAAKGTAFFRSTVGPLSLPGSNPATASPYLGTEVYGEIDWRPLSDLGLSLAGGFFFANDGSAGALVENLLPEDYLIRVTASFSF
ncbi:MAG: hypothetical protein ACLQMF_00060 [Rectinemataceae bacterium]